MSAGSGEIPCNLWKPKFLYHVHNSPPSVPILGKMNPVYTFPAYFLNIHGIILPSMPWSTTWSLSFTYPQQNPVSSSLSPVCATCPTHLMLLYFITQIILQIIKHAVIMQYSPASCYFLCLRSKHLPQCCILKCPKPMFFPQFQRVL